LRHKFLAIVTLLRVTLTQFAAISGWSEHRVHTEWQRPLSCLRSIMMEKLAQTDEGGGARPTPFTIVTITNKVAVSAPAERADTLPLFHLFPYVLCGSDESVIRRGLLQFSFWDFILKGSSGQIRSARERCH
jgi:hypothetical protein